MPSQSKRSHLLFVRLTPEERTALRDAAQRDERTMSSWTRLAILRALQAERRKQPQREPEAVSA